MYFSAASRIRKTSEHSQNDDDDDWSEPQETLPPQTKKQEPPPSTWKHDSGSSWQQNHKNSKYTLELYSYCLKLTLCL